MPAISVILPVYNCELYVKIAIESILNQSFKDFELIIIDDGSVDRSLEIIQQYEHDKRVRIISRSNKGLPATLNEAITQASSPWIARMDADDISMPNRLERQFSIARENSYDIIGSNIIQFGKERKRVVYPEKDLDIKLNIFLWKRIFCHPAVLVKLDVFEKMKYNEKLKTGQDTELWMRTTLIDGIKYFNIQEDLLNYRKHEKQASTNSREVNRQQRISAMRDLLKLHMVLFTEEDLDLHSRIRQGESVSNSELNQYVDFIGRIDHLFITKYNYKHAFRHCNFKLHLQNALRKFGIL